MAAVKVCFFLVLFSILFVGFAQQNGGAAAPPCMNKVLPCQPYLKLPSNPPPACCVPLNDLVANQPQCMCQFFNDAALLKNLNITQDDALQLTKRCHANADVSQCKNATVVSPMASPVIPSTSIASSPASPAKSGAAGVRAYVGGSAVVAVVVFLAISNMGF